MAKRNWKITLEKIKKIEGYLVPGQEIALTALAYSLREGSTIVEIGSYLGRSTACLAVGSPKTSKIYAIDTFEGNQKDFRRGRDFRGGNFYKKFEKNLKKLRVFSKITPLKGFSQEIGKKWNKEIDLLFIDGSHVYEDVKEDFELFYPWVRRGGLVAFHDVDPKFPGVLRVWKETAKNKLSSWDNISTLYFGYKPVFLFSRLIDTLRILILEVPMAIIKIKSQ